MSARSTSNRTAIGASQAAFVSVVLSRLNRLAHLLFLLRGGRQRRRPHRQAVGGRPVVRLGGGHPAVERRRCQPEPLPLVLENVVGLKDPDRTPW